MAKRWDVRTVVHFHSFKIKRAVVTFLRPAPRPLISQLDFWITMTHVKCINTQPTILTAHVTEERGDSLCKIHDYADQ